jgi:hypothetical protein
MGLLGLLPMMVLLREWVRERLPLRRALQFRAKAGIEVIVTTSHTAVSHVGPADESKRARRALVPSGDLAGVAEITAKLARVYPKRRLVIVPSAKAGEENASEKLIVGGPVHNRWASHVVCATEAEAIDGTEVVFDADRRFIRFGQQVLGPDLDLKFEENVPHVDYALIVLTKVNRFGSAQRVVVVGGLTTYGTHAAAHFLAHDLTQFLSTIGKRKNPQIAILLKARLANGKPFAVDPVAHISVS